MLQPYRTSIDRWLWSDTFKNQDTSVAKAKKAIADYKKAVGQPESLAELRVFDCKRAAGFSNDVGLQDEGYFDAQVRMFERALKAIGVLTGHRRPEVIAHLGAVRSNSRNFSSRVADDMDELLAGYGFDVGSR